MTIPRAFIDDLLARVDIVELIDQRVPLKKAGKNYSACCPFHNEKSPSFTVSQDKQFYHCFGCGAHGNAISFLMDYDRMEFPEAVEELARGLGLEVPREESGNARSSNYQPSAASLDFYALMQKAAAFYRHQLAKHDESQRAIGYLKNRGLTGDIAKQFGIGYAGPEWDALMRQLGGNEKTQQDLVALGMLIQKENGRRYDRFRDRIMFPIRDRRGRVLGFGGRILDKGEPKYLNSPETPIFHKGKELYGLYEARQANRHLNRIVIVEGYMDVVALAQHGISYAVASLGTATTEEQMQLLFRQCKHITCCYDGDTAGKGAAWRALENALPHLKDGCTLDFVFLPDGEDPDTLVRDQGKHAFEQLLQQAQPLSQVLFEQLLKQHQATTDAGKSALVSAATPLLQRLPDTLYREMLVEQLAKLIGREPEQLTGRLALSQQPAIAAKPPQMKKTPMRLAIALLVQYPELALTVPVHEEFASVGLPGAELFNALLKVAKQHPGLNSAALLEHFRGSNSYDSLSRMLFWDIGIGQAEQREKEFLDTYSYFINIYIEQRYEQLLLKEKQNQMTWAERRELFELVKLLKQSDTSQG